MRRLQTALARAALLATLASPLTAGLTLASDEPPRLGLTPVGHEGSYFELTTDAGETRRLEVEVANFGGQEVAARLYTADVYSIVNGGFGAELFGDEPSGTTLWLGFPTQQLTLGPRESLVIAIELRVPAEAAPGEYLTSLVVENAEPFSASAEGGIGVEQVNRHAVAVAIKVRGARQPALEVGAVRHQLAGGLSVITFEVANTGNVHLKPSGQFILRDAAGIELARAAVAMDSVYAATTARLEAPLANSLLAGDYCAELSLRDEATGAHDASECLPFTVAPAVEETAAARPQATTILQPVVDAAGANPVAVSVLLALLVAATAASLGLRGRDRRLVRMDDRRTGGDRLPSRPAWPATDPLPDDDLDHTPVAELPLLLLLRDELRLLPAVERAWLVDRHGAMFVAIEGAPGMTPAEGARIAGELQHVADRPASEPPVRVVFLQGPGPVARFTGGSQPFYRRQAHWMWSNA